MWKNRAAKRSDLNHILPISDSDHWKPQNCQTKTEKKTDSSFKAGAMLVLSSFSARLGFPAAAPGSAFPLSPAAQQRILQPGASAHLLDQKKEDEEEEEAAEPTALFGIRERVTTPGQDLNTLRETEEEINTVVYKDYGPKYFIRTKHWKCPKPQCELFPANLCKQQNCTNILDCWTTEMSQSNKDFKLKVKPDKYWTDSVFVTITAQVTPPTEMCVVLSVC